MDQPVKKSAIGKVLLAVLAIAILAGTIFFVFSNGKPVTTQISVNPSPLNTSNITSPTPKPALSLSGYTNLKTSANKSVYVSLLALSNNKWGQVSLEKKIRSFLVGIARAEDPKQIVIDFSKNFSEWDSFDALEPGPGGDWFLAGGTIHSVNFYQTDFASKLTDLKSAFSGVHQNTLISSVAKTGSIWLVGMDNTAGEKAQLYSFDGAKATDISAKLNPPENSSVSAIRCTASGVCLIIVEARNYSGDNRIYQYNNGTVTDISNKFPAGKRYIRGVETNGSYWLLGGATYPSTDRETDPSLFKYDGTNVTDLSSSIQARGTHNPQIQTISWNGKAFLIGGDDQGRPGQPSTFGGLLYLYDGQNFTNLSDRLEIQYITKIGSDGKGWLIGGYKWVIYRFDGQSFERVPIEGVNAKGVNVVKSIAWDGENYIVGGWQSLIMKIRFVD